MSTPKSIEKIRLTPYKHMNVQENIENVVHIP